MTEPVGIEAESIKNVDRALSQFLKDTPGLKSVALIMDWESEAEVPENSRRAVGVFRTRTGEYTVDNTLSMQERLLTFLGWTVSGIIQQLCMKSVEAAEKRVVDAGERAGKLLEDIRKMEDRLSVREAKAQAPAKAPKRGLRFGRKKGRKS